MTKDTELKMNAKVALQTLIIGYPGGMHELAVRSGSSVEELELFMGSNDGAGPKDYNRLIPILKEIALMVNAENSGRMCTTMATVLSYIIARRDEVNKEWVKSFRDMLLTRVMFIASQQEPPCVIKATINDDIRCKGYIKAMMKGSTGKLKFEVSKEKVTISRDGVQFEVIGKFSDGVLAVFSNNTMVFVELEDTNDAKKKALIYEKIHTMLKNLNTDIWAPLRIDALIHLPKGTLFMYPSTFKRYALVVEENGVDFVYAIGCDRPMKLSEFVKQHVHVFVPVEVPRV